MATVKGREAVSRYLARIPADMEKVLRGAGRAAATVIADEAKERCISSEVRDAIKLATKIEPGTITAKVQVKGKGAYIAPWLEYGTAAHFISVDDSQREGRSVARLNKTGKEAGSLAINGKPVGTTVFHPGARAHPFLRPALDTKEAEAIAAAQKYITKRVARSGLSGSDDAEADV